MWILAWKREELEGGVSRSQGYNGNVAGFIAEISPPIPLRGHLLISFFLIYIKGVRKIP